LPLDKGNRPGKGEAHDVIDDQSMHQNKNPCPCRVSLNHRVARREQRRKGRDEIVQWPWHVALEIKAKERTARTPSKHIQTPVDPPPHQQRERQKEKKLLNQKVARRDVVEDENIQAHKLSKHPCNDKETQNIEAGTGPKRRLTANKQARKERHEYWSNHIVKTVYRKPW
jgi:hypothetical protein